ncbi:MAG: HIT family protein, partial [Candidatus Liptonbacteria bacterium]|nr:HIT family protein [Candidatus Liptonbacteria bacterium]
MNDCVFCRIAAKEIAAETVYEDDRVLAFLDAHPHVPGHLLVIPKRHAADLAELPDEDVAPFFSAVKKLSKTLAAALRADGMTIGINQGAAGGQAVPHLHLHLMPRFADDGGGSVHTVVVNPPQESLGAIAARIRRALSPHAGN